MIRRRENCRRYTKELTPGPATLGVFNFDPHANGKSPRRKRSLLLVIQSPWVTRGLLPAWPSLHTSAKAAPCPGRWPDTGAPLGTGRVTCIQVTPSCQVCSLGNTREYQGQMWPMKSCPNPWWRISEKNLLFHSPLSAATLGPFPSTRPYLCIATSFYFSGLFPSV